MRRTRRPSAGEPLRVVRIISRLNIGGPAIQAITVTKMLDERGYKTTLVRGTEGPDEGSMDYLADEWGVRPVYVPALQRETGPHDLRALLALMRILWRERPHVVHTHAAKAGTLGRVAALVACRVPGRRCVLVHTFHGHSLSGYFSSRRNRVFGTIERVLARRTDRIVAVSEEVRDDLVRFGVAAPERFQVVRLGFDLSPFVTADRDREALRRAVRDELGIPQDARVVTLIARLAPIKRVDRFLRIAERLRDEPGIRFLVVGDGELRDELQASPEARSLGERLVWAGFRRDMPAVCVASDVVVLTSDNEGTPVSLIEAQAAGVPVVSTAVGGASTTVLDGITGYLAPADREDELAEAIRGVLSDPAAREVGARGQAHVTGTFSLERLVDDLDSLYRGALA
jgi:glycosyltransferase involved in cell wall biosynthesis